MEQSILDRTEDWARSVLESLGVPPTARGTGGVPLTINIDEIVHPRQKTASFGPDHPDIGLDDASPPRRPPSRRDSQRRREALLKGKEGSRQRRRWENDRLMHVPNVQPPLPTDWEVHPTHPVHHNLPYHVAHYWDRGLRQYVNETRAAAAVLRRKQIVAMQSGTTVVIEQQTTGTSPSSSSSSSTFGMVTRELRASAKKTPAIKTWVRALEEPMRQYLAAAEAARRAAEDDDEVVLDDEDDDDDISSEEKAGIAYSSDTFAFSDHEDDIVFVGRRKLMSGDKAKASWKRAHREVDHRYVDSGIVFDSLGDGESGSFKRWLAHSISEYYGLTSQSTTIGSPANRVVYVALREETVSPGAGPIIIPRPMWELF